MHLRETAERTLQRSTETLRVDDLMAAAKERCGLEDFGDAWFMEPLEVLVKSLDTESELPERGVELTRHRLISLLVDRLRLRALQAAHPEVLDVPVRVLAEICGMPRTGSTLLQRLLAASPQLTSTVSWETTYPIPLTDEDAHATERKRRARTRMEAAAAASPEFTQIHTGTWDAVDEDVVLVDRSFMSMSFESFYWVPSYGDWLRNADHAPAYAELRQWLQVLAWQQPGRAERPWVLKSPHHLVAVDAVLEGFPECHVVMTHRSPVSTVPSYASMCAALMSSYDDAVQRGRLGPYWADRFAGDLARLHEARDRRPDRFVDVRYEDTATRPAEVALEVLERLGVHTGPADVAAIEECLRANRSEPRHGHRYTLQDFGLDDSRLEEQFAGYVKEYL